MAEVVINKIDIAFLRSFPNVSVMLKQVQVKSAWQHSNAGHSSPIAGNSIEATSIFLELSIIDVLQKNYTVKSLRINGASLSVVIDKEGHHNLHILKPGNTNQKGINISLNRILVSDTKLQLQHAGNKLDLHYYIKQARLNGRFIPGAFQFDIRSSGLIQLLSLDNSYTIKNEKIRIKGGIDKSNNLFTIKASQLNTEALQLAVSGAISTTKNSYSITLTTENAPIEQLLMYLPKEVNRQVSRHLQTGNLQAMVTLQSASQRKVRINSNFKVTNMPVKINDSTRILVNKVEGVFSNGKLLNKTSAYAEIRHASIMGSNGSAVTLYGSVSNFKEPFTDIFLNGTLTLADAIHFVKPGQRTMLQSGEVSGNLHVSGTWPNVAHPSANDFINMLQQARLKAQNIHLKVNNINLTLNGKVQVEHIVRFDSCGVNLNGQQLRLSGSMPLSNLYAGNRTWKTDIEIEADSLNILQLLNVLPQNKASDKQKQWQVNASLNIGEARYNKMELNTIRTQLSYINNKLQLYNFNARLCEGMVTGNAIVQRRDNYESSVQVNYKHVNIHDLFYSFNNFKQNFITANNLRGFISGNTRFSAELNAANLKLVQPSIQANSYIEVSDGEIRNFEPLYTLSRYVELEELKELRFSNLQNNIVIKNEAVHIPEMNIFSNAANLSVSGIHYFDNTFDYSFNVDLSTALGNKFRKNRNKQQEFGYIVDNREKLNLPLRISGNPENYKIKWDKKRARENIKESIQYEKNELDNLFGQSHADTSTNTTIENNEHQIQWDDE